MKVGISSFTYGCNIGVNDFMPVKAMNEIDLLNLVLDFGLDCLQIGDNLPIHTFDNSRKEKFKDLIEKHQIRLEIGAKKLTNKNLKTYIDLCVFLRLH